MTEPRPNFFILLNLPLEHDPSASEIKSAIDSARRKWNKERTHPRKNLEAVQHIQRLPEIEAVLKDPAQRELERQTALKESKEQEKRTFEEIDRMVQMLSLHSGFVSEKDVQKLCKKFPLLSQSQIESRIQVPIRKETVATPEQKALDPTLLKEVQSKLQIVGKKSLYEALECSSSSSLQILTRHANDMYQTYSKTANKTSEVTAYLALSGLCKTIFANEKQRARYDYSLSMLRLKALDPELEAAGFDGQVSPIEFEHLLTEAGKLGVSPAEARAYFQNIFKQKSWVVIIPEKTKAESLPRCMACGVINRPNAKYCSACSFPLSIQCPRCKTPTLGDETVCIQCGFVLGDLPNALKLLSRAKKSLREDFVSEAESFIKQASRIWSDHPDIEKLSREIAKANKAVKAISQKLNQAINEREYYAAEAFLNQLKKRDSNHAELRHEKQIKRQIAQAERLISQAQRQSSDDAIELYVQALKYAKDARAAIDGLAASPPDAPTYISAAVSSGNIQLKWQPARSKGELLYRVLRKARACPLHDLDGEVIQENAHSQCIDHKAKPGESYFYAVFTIRGGISSRRGLTTDELIRCEEIQDLSLLPGNNTVQMKWKLPPRAQGVEVTRWQEPGASQTKILTIARNDGLLDNQVRNNQSYMYCIKVCYRALSGKVLWSEGTIVQAQPDSPPLPIRNLKARKEHSQWLLTWSPPPKGQVLIYASNKRPEYTPGEVCPLERLDQLGDFLGEQSDLGRLKVDLSFLGYLYLLPVTQFNSVAVIGEAIGITSIENVKNISAYNTGSTLYLEWVWPQACTQVHVSFRHDCEPESPTDARATHKKVTLRQYEKDHALLIRQMEQKPYFFKIFVTARATDGQALFSSGVKFIYQREETKEIEYDVTLKKGFLGKNKKAFLNIRCLSEACTLPELLLVKKSRSLPVRSGDGKVIDTLAPMMIDPNNSVTIEIKPEHLQANTFVKLFPVNKDEGKQIRFLTRGKNTLSLG